jgi:mono/diheme cytochrome c family protein
MNQFLKVIIASACVLFIARSVEAHAAENEKGAKIFQQHCVTCHNKQPSDDSPFGPPNLYRVFRGPAPLSSAEAKTIIENGKNGMPSFGKTLDKSKIASVIEYLQGH